MTQLGQDPPEGFKNDPVLGSRREPRPARGRARRREALRRGSRGDDPLHRDERGRDRRVAHHVLDGELPAAAGGLPAAAPALKTPWLSLIVFAGVVAIGFLLPGQVDFLGRMYAFGAMLSFTIAHASRRPAAAAPPRRRAPVPRQAEPADRGVDWPLFAIVGGARHGDRVARRRDPGRADAVRRPRVARGRVRLLPALPARGSASRCARRRARRSCSAPAIALEYRNDPRSDRRGPTSRARRSTSPPGSPPSAARRSWRCASSSMPMELPLDAELVERGGRGQPAARRGARDRGALRRADRRAPRALAAAPAARSSRRPSGARPRSSSSARRAAPSAGRSSARPSTTS